MDDDAAQAFAYQLEIEHRQYEEEVLNLIGGNSNGFESEGARTETK